MSSSSSSSGRQYQPIVLNGPAGRLLGFLIDNKVSRYTVIAMLSDLGFSSGFRSLPSPWGTLREDLFEAQLPMPPLPCSSDTWLWGKFQKRISEGGCRARPHI